jgi:hypothetical protein
MATNNATNTSKPITVAQGGTGATTLTGIVTGSGTSALTATAVTQYNVLIGGSSNGITSLAPSATSGVPLISQGSSSNPAFGTGFKIDSSGRTVNANQPAFLAYLSAATALNKIGNGSTFYTVLYDTVVFDQNSNYNSGTGTFTAPVAGKYFFTMQISVQPTTGSSAQNAQAQFVATSRSAYTAPATYNVYNPNSFLTLNSNFLVDMAVSDTIYTRVYGTYSGGTNSMGIYGSGSPYFTYFSGYLVC